MDTVTFFTVSMFSTSNRKVHEIHSFTDLFKSNYMIKTIMLTLKTVTVCDAGPLKHLSHSGTMGAYSKGIYTNSIQGIPL